MFWCSSCRTILQKEQLDCHSPT
ncbi:hypothetical protein [Flavobacterium sp. ACN2]